MRLGAPLERTSTPDEWIQNVQQHGYRAAYCPIEAAADSITRRAYAQAAEHADIVIAEVGAWSNPISPDDTIRLAAIEKCQTQLDLADEVGALCCVNIAGSRGTQWDGPHADNFSAATFDLIVETVQSIIDAVKPTRAVYTLEPMPWIVPDSPESYLELIRAIDRPQFGVHLDPVNMIASPRLYYGNTAFLKACFATLGPYIKSVHAKDITIRTTLTTHLDEVRPGLGSLDYATFLQCVDQLGDMPLMLEHLPQEEYAPAAAYVRQMAHSLSIAL